MSITLSFIAALAGASCPSHLADPFADALDHAGLIREAGINHALHFEEILPKGHDARFLHVDLGDRRALLVARVAWVPTGEDSAHSLYVTVIEHDHLARTIGELHRFADGDLERFVRRHRPNLLEAAVIDDERRGLASYHLELAVADQATLARLIADLRAPHFETSP